MSEVTVRLLAERDWDDYRAVRLAALQESPAAFLDTYAEESAYDETCWRARMLSAARFLAERDHVVQGTASLAVSGDDGDIADVYGLWVAPAARNSGVSWRLVEAAAEHATKEGRTHLYYWVSTENIRAIAFASNFGFLVSPHRRVSRGTSGEFGDEEMAMVLPLGADPSSVPNPTRPTYASAAGPS